MCLLVALWAAGCGGGGGGGLQVDAAQGGGDDAGPGSDASNTDAAIDATLAATNDRCANATPISLATMHVSLPANPVGAHADLAAPCGTAGQPDVFFKFELTRRELVYADTFAGSSATTLFFASSCSTALTSSTTPNDAVCSTGACTTSQSQVMALLAPGTYYLVLAGGAATINFQHAEVGTGDVTYVPQGSSTLTGTTASSGLLFACEGGGGEDSFWWPTCPLDGGGSFTGSTCTGTQFDTILSLQLPGTEQVFCDDDSCSRQSSVTANIPGGAGLHVLAVDGNSLAQFGNYTLTTSRP